LIIVGNGVLETALKTQYQSKKSIHFLDFQNQHNMPSVYAAANVFVLPSKGPGETWGLSVNEAMANGKAVIVSDKCGCALDLIEDGYNGFRFEAGNRGALMQAMEQLIQQPMLVKQMGLNSKKKIEAFSPKKLAEVIENLV